MEPTRRPDGVSLADLTPHLVCTLCGGYYIDATTIVECLHTFCRSCIIRHLDRSSYCPALTCDVMIHRTKGAVSLRADTTLQSVVYKTVPGLHRNEMQRRRQFYTDKPHADTDLPTYLKGCQGEGAGRYYAPDDTIDVRIQYASPSADEVVHVRYLRCPAGLPLTVLKKFLYQKYRFPDHLQLELIHGRKVLPQDIKLLDVAYIVNWSRKSVLKLLFRMSKSKTSIKRHKSVAGPVSDSLGHESGLESGTKPVSEPPAKTRKLSRIISDASYPGPSKDGNSTLQAHEDRSTADTPVVSRSETGARLLPAPECQESPNIPQSQVLGPAQRGVVAQSRTVAMASSDKCTSHQRMSAVVPIEKNILRPRTSAVTSNEKDKTTPKISDVLSCEKGGSDKRTSSVRADVGRNNQIKSSFVSPDQKRDTSLNPTVSTSSHERKTAQENLVSTTAKTETQLKLSSEEAAQKIGSRPRPPGLGIVFKKNAISKGAADSLTPKMQPMKSPTVVLSQVTVKSNQNVSSLPQSQVSMSGPKVFSTEKKASAVPLAQAYLAGKHAMKLPSSSAGLKGSGSAIGISLPTSSSAHGKSAATDTVRNLTNGKGVISKLMAPIPPMVSKDSDQTQSSPSESPTRKTQCPVSTVSVPEDKPAVNKVDCSVQTVPIYRVHSSKQSIVKPGKTSHGTNTHLSSPPRKRAPDDKMFSGKPAAKSTKFTSETSSSMVEKHGSKAETSRPFLGVLDLSTHSRESPTVVGNSKDSKTIFVISGTKKSHGSNKIQSIVESLAQKRLQSSSPHGESQVKPTDQSGVAVPSVLTPPVAMKRSVSSSSNPFRIPSPAVTKTTACTNSSSVPAKPRSPSVSSPLHIETYSSSLPPLPGLSTLSSSVSSRPVFPVMPLPQRPRSQSVHRSIPNPSLVRQRSAEERARDRNKSSPTVGATAPTLSPAGVTELHSLTRQLQEAGTSVTITNTSC